LTCQRKIEKVRQDETQDRREREKIRAKANNCYKKKERKEIDTERREENKSTISGRKLNCVKTGKTARKEYIGRGPKERSMAVLETEKSFSDLEGVQC
jgi:hypothetical protein